MRVLLAVSTNFTDNPRTIAWYHVVAVVKYFVVYCI